jgi:hypothetical protein
MLASSVTLGEDDPSTLSTKGCSGPRACNDAVTSIKYAFHNYIILLIADSCVKNWTLLGNTAVQRNFNTVQTTQNETMKYQLKLTCFS